MKVLVAGWFSFENMGASAGDLLARDLVCRWLAEEALDCDIAVAPPFTDGLAWQEADPGDYAGVIFVCGPFGNGPPLTSGFLSRFSGLPLVGVNLSMLQNLEEWNPFDLLLERDSNQAVRPDLVFLTEQSPVPVVGLILVHPQNEYGSRGRHRLANEAVRRLIDSREMAVVSIDTRLDDNQVGLRSPGEVEALIARMDAVITTRLHGMVMAIKNGVPPLVLDPIAGGAKILRQAKVFEWPMTYLADEVNDEQLKAGLEFCLSPQGRGAASATRDRARELLRDVRAHFVSGIQELVQVGV